VQVNIYCKDCCSGTEFIYTDGMNDWYIQWQAVNNTHINAPAYDVLTANKELNKFRKIDKESGLVRHTYYIKPIKEA